VRTLPAPIRSQTFFAARLAAVRFLPIAINSRFGIDGWRGTDGFRFPTASFFGM
jgi:hypothetical protein